MTNSTSSSGGFWSSLWESTKHVLSGYASCFQFEISYGTGFGASAGSLGKVRFDIVPVRQTHIFSVDGHQMRTSSDFGVSVDVGKDKLGLTAHQSYSWPVPGNGEHETMVGGYVGPFQFGNLDSRDNNDFIFSIGAGGYIGSGGEVYFEFNFSRAWCVLTGRL